MDIIMDLAPAFWLALMIVFLVVEASCPIHLVSVWFAVGALAATVASMLGGPIWLQVVLFIAVSAALLALMWPLVRKYLNPRITPTNVDSIIGTAGHVTADIDNDGAHGQVKLGAMEWSARSTSGAPIPKGTLVRVDRVEGVKVFVTPTEASVTIK